MFEEICLMCGKHLPDDGQAYCSEECQNLDVTSPSISSASSALSSPHLGYTMGGDVPALVPSALGSALKNYHGRDRYSVSSSSASSTSWSVVTDDDDDDAQLGVGSEYSFQGDGDSLYEGSSKSANYLYSMHPSALSYARRPSGTNNRSTVPLLHRRTSSGSSSGHVHGVPRSAPIHSHSSAEDDEDYSSDFGFMTRDEDSLGQAERDPVKEHDREKGTNKSTITAKAKRIRNRASLPAYFSLLQTGGSSTEQRCSPMSSSANTVARPSPPTPKLTLTGLATGLSHSSTAPPTASIQATPRGRRRDPGTSRGSRRSEHSRSCSHSRPRNVTRPPQKSDVGPRARLDSKNSVEQVFDWSSMSMARGRTAVRRNSSPPPKMMLSALALGSSIAVQSNSPAGSGSGTRTKARGRARADELDGNGLLAEAPGYGIGRSGLLDRERSRGIGGPR